MSHPWFRGSAYPRVLAHRGLIPSQKDIVENSLAAVAHAHVAGVEYIESDCRLTRDGVAVLFHDETVARLTRDRRKVSELDYDELAGLLEHRGSLLTLKDALGGFPTLRFNLDVKTDAAAVPVGELVARHASRVLLTSFSDRRRRAALAAAAAAVPGARPATAAGTATVARVLWHARTRNEAGARRALGDVDALQIPECRGNIRVLVPRLIDLAHQHGVEVHVWTVNNRDDMQRLISFGVDGIVTDRADLALQTLAPRYPLR